LAQATVVQAVVFEFSLCSAMAILAETTSDSHTPLKQTSSKSLHPDTVDEEGADDRSLDGRSVWSNVRNFMILWWRSSGPPGLTVSLNKDMAQKDEHWLHSKRLYALRSILYAPLSRL